MKLSIRNARRAGAANVSKRLVRLRTEAKLSQAAVARSMGVRPEAVWRMEQGKHCPHLGHLAAYCTAVGVDLEAVFSVDHPLVDLEPA